MIVVSKLLFLVQLCPVDCHLEDPSSRLRGSYVSTVQNVVRRRTSQNVFLRDLGAPEAVLHDVLAHEQLGQGPPDLRQGARKVLRVDGEGQELVEAVLPYARADLARGQGTSLVCSRSG